MFTGIVKEIGKLRKIISRETTYQLVIDANKILLELSKGDSIAVNGVCLTAVEIGRDYFVADVMPQTLYNTNLEKVKTGTEVNLEPALKSDDFLGGHFVTGHVDGTGLVKKIKSDKNALLVEISLSSELLKYIVDRGSIAVNGVSLTVMEVKDSIIIISLIPETRETTNLDLLTSGDEVNIETDLLGKYVYKILKGGQEENEQGVSSTVNKEILRDNGFL